MRAFARVFAALYAATFVLAFDAAVQQAALLTNQSLFWNTYRPQLYHGIRPRTPHSLMTGLMWFTLNDYTGNQVIRHTCEQSDGITSYGYTKHDGRYYATQDIVDAKLNVKFTTSWLKSEDGADWSVRIEGEAVDPTKPSRVSLIYHLGLEGLGNLKVDGPLSSSGFEGEVVLKGSSPQLGNFRIRIVDHPDVTYLAPVLHPEPFKDVVGKTNFASMSMETGSVWKIKDYILRLIDANARAIMGTGQFSPESPPDPLVLFQLPNINVPSANVWAFQKAFGSNANAQKGKFGFDVYYESLDGTNESEKQSYTALSNSLVAASKQFDQRFEETFPLKAPYDDDEHRDFAKAMTANMIGGIGYYHGSSIVDRTFKHDYDDDEDTTEEQENEDEDEEDEEWDHSKEKPLLTEERELLTATPSRSFFPRGFYWDEGFHLALIGEWDNDLSLEILRDWIALVDEDGWVAREQILGEESRSKVPAEFQTQYPSYANPPTLAMTVTSFIKRLRENADASMLDAALGMGTPKGFSPTSGVSSLPSLHLKNPSLAQAYLKSIYPALRRHYLWFRRTQRGLLKPFGRTPPSKIEAYRWRGRTEDHVLTSGLDDYPRARPPHSGELHVDLISWVAFFARTMGEISEHLGLEDDLKEYKRHEKGALANLDALHWSEEEQMYCDVSVNEDDESYHVCHRGYISLFPLLLGLVEPDSPHLSAILDLVTDPKQLRSPYGLRSLSISHELFGKGENYWKGPIWIPMNFLALKSLKERYSVEEGPYKERAAKVYAELRKNVVDNVYNEYQRTGYVWEQYDSETGKGQRSHPFTGWTALVTMIMTEKYS